MNKAGDPPEASVLVVADVAVVCESISLWLRSHNGFARVETASVANASGLMASSRPDLVLAECSAVRSTDLMAQATTIGARVVVIGVRDADDAEVLACAESGVGGFLARDASLDDLLTALQTAHNGGVHCSPCIADTLCRRLASIASAPTAQAHESGLSRREREIVELMQAGLTNKEIAAQLGIATATAKNHVHSVLLKLGVHRRTLVAAPQHRSTAAPQHRSTAAPQLPRSSRSTTDHVIKRTASRDPLV